MRDELHSRRRATPLAIELLDELATRLPDHSWLVQVKVAEENVEIVGYSSATPALVTEFRCLILIQRCYFCVIRKRAIRAQGGTSFN